MDSLGHVSSEDEKRVSSRETRAVRANEHSEQPSGLFKTQLSLTGVHIL